MYNVHSAFQCNWPLVLFAGHAWGARPWDLVWGATLAGISLLHACGSALAEIVLSMPLAASCPTDMVQVEPAVRRLLRADRPGCLPALYSLLERFALPHSPLPEPIAPLLHLLVPPLACATGVHHLKTHPETRAWAEVHIKVLEKALQKPLVHQCWQLGHGHGREISGDASNLTDRSGAIEAEASCHATAHNRAAFARAFIVQSCGTGWLAYGLPRTVGLV